MLPASFALLQEHHAPLIKNSVDMVCNYQYVYVCAHIATYMHVHAPVRVNIYTYTVDEFCILLLDCGLVTGSKFFRYFMQFISRIKAQ